MFEDDGKVASFSTSAVYDAQRGRFFLHGMYANYSIIKRLKIILLFYRTDVTSTYSLQDVICDTLMNQITS